MSTKDGEGPDPHRLPLSTTVPQVSSILCANGCGQSARKWVQDVPFCHWRCHFEWGFRRAMAQTTAHAERITACPKCGNLALRDDGRLGKSCSMCGKAHIGFEPGVDRPRPKRPRHYIKTSVLAD